MGDPALYKSLAKDGASRAEVRAICAEPLIDYSRASWGEWETLALVAEACCHFGGCVSDANTENPGGARVHL